MTNDKCPMSNVQCPMSNDQVTNDKCPMANGGERPWFDELTMTALHRAEFP